MLTIVERVILLQEVDAFEDVPTDCLSRIAAAAEELEYSKGEALFKEGEPACSMFLVVEGRVRVVKGAEEVMTAGPGEALGAWSLFGDERRLATATAEKASLLLRIGREDFLDVLADDVNVAQGLLLSLVRRLRALVEISGAEVSGAEAGKGGR